MAPAGSLVRDVILRDGSTLRLRPPVADDARGRPRLLREPLGRERVPAVPRLPLDWAGARRALPRSRLERARCPRGDARRGNGRADRGARELRAPPRSVERRDCVRRRGRAAGPRRRHPAARAAGGARGADRNRILRRRGDVGKPVDAATVRGRGLRDRSPARGWRGRGAAGHRGDGCVRRARGRARSRRRDGIACSVLLAADGCRGRGFLASRVDRGRALPQRAGRRLRRHRVPRQPQGRARRRCARLPDRLPSCPSR